MKGHFNMIQVYNNKSECCGCGICETVCTQNAIEMKMDEIGVIYPKINQEKCIDCGACKKICSYNADGANIIKKVMQPLIRVIFFYKNQLLEEYFLR